MDFSQSFKTNFVISFQILGIVGGKLGHPAAQRAANLAMSSSKIVLNSDSDGLGPDQGLSGKPDLKDGNISGPEKDEDDDFWN